MRETFIVADAYMFAVLRWSPRVGIDLSKWSNIEAYLDRVAARPKVREAIKRKDYCSSSDLAVIYRIRSFPTGVQSCRPWSGHRRRHHCRPHSALLQLAKELILFSQHSDDLIVLRVQFWKNGHNKATSPSRKCRLTLASSFYDCKWRGERLKPKPGDCCVFCS